MMHRLLADFVVVVHFAFVLYVIFGGLLVLKWKWTVLLHLPALVWGTIVELMGWICPLTPLENSLRTRAGASGYPTGFVDHYILPVLYPAALDRPAQWTLAASLVVFNLIVYGWYVRKKGL